MDKIKHGYYVIPVKVLLENFHLLDKETQRQVSLDSIIEKTTNVEKSYIVKK